MLRRQCFVLALGIVGLLVPAVEAQQSVTVTDDPYFAAGQPPAAQAPQKENWWQRWKRDYHRNQCWPEPFIAGDRQAEIMPFEIMANNAWQRQLLLSDYHFVQGTTELNDAGKFKLLWIISKVPAQRRAVYVERLMSDQTTAERMAAVQKAIVRLAPNRPSMPVYESNLGPGEWSGASAVATQNANEKTVPDPRLPTAARTTISQ
jgi:hypothetical protein